MQYTTPNTLNQNEIEDFIKSNNIKTLFTLFFKQIPLKFPKKLIRV